MGRKKREKPARLSEKLRQIREMLRLSQLELVRRMGLEDRLTKSEISAFERGTHEPNLLVLLAYSDIANVFLEVLVRDSLDLPDNLPSSNKHQGVSKKTKRRNARGRED
jgi:transcriptional regulator with XRE-family HTH domain